MNSPEMRPATLAALLLGATAAPTKRSEYAASVARCDARAVADKVQLVALELRLPAKRPAPSEAPSSSKRKKRRKKKKEASE